MDKEYKKLMKAELARYDMSLRAFLLGYHSYQVGRYIKSMRIVQYCARHRNLYYLILRGINQIVMRRVANRIGFQFNPQKIGWGITIFHLGSIVINHKAIIGDNVCLYPGVCIGRTADDRVPTIGNNVTFFTNSAAYGGVHIGNNVTIAPNAVVTHDVPDDCVVAGVPAKVIKFK